MKNAFSRAREKSPTVESQHFILLREEHEVRSSRRFRDIHVNRNYRVATRRLTECERIDVSITSRRNRCVLDVKESYGSTRSVDSLAENFPRESTYVYSHASMSRNRKIRVDHKSHSILHPFISLFC